MYRRHSADCEILRKPRNARGARNCKDRCPLWVQDSLRGEYTRKALNVTSGEAASERVRSWETSGEIGVARALIPTIKEGVKFTADEEAQI